MKMKKTRTALALMIVAALAASPVLIRGAGGTENQAGNTRGTTASEAVDLQTDPSGQVKSARVIEFMGLQGGGPASVRQRSELKPKDLKWQGVHGFTAPKVEGNELVWEVRGKGNRSVVSSAEVKNRGAVRKLTTRIPLDVRYRYWLDGVEVKDPATISGRSGHFKVELRLTNTSKQMTDVEYRDSSTGRMVRERVETYLPLVILPYDWYFDNTIFYNLKADPTGMVVYFPDFYTVGWSIPLFPPATGESHTIWVESDVKDFSMPPLLLSANFVFPETNQRDTLPEFIAGLEQLYGGVKQLDAGLGEAVAGLGSASQPDTMLYGTNAVLEGLKQLAGGLPEAQAGINNEMIPGVNQAVAGVGSPGTPNTLLYAIDRTSAGLNQMKAGIGGPGEQDTLQYAMSQMGSGLEQMKSGIGAPGEKDTLMYGVSRATGGLEEMKEGIGASAAKDTLLYAINQMRLGVNEMRAGIGSATTPDTLLYAMSAMKAGLQQSLAGIGSPTTPNTLQYAVSAMQSGLNQMKAGIGDASSADTLLWGLAQMSAGLRELSGGFTPMDFALKWNRIAVENMRAMIDAHMPEPYRSQVLHWIDDQPLGMRASLAQVNDGVIEMWQGVGNEKTPDTLLYGADQLRAGLEEMKAGLGAETTADTLLYAAAQVQAGLDMMKAGIGSASTGNTLLYAVEQVEGGLKQIKEGLGTPGTTNSLSWALGQVENGLKLMQGGIGSENAPDTLLYAMNAMNSGLQQMKEGIGSATTSDTLLYATSQVQNGLDIMKAGIGDASMSDTMLYAMSQVQGGLYQISSGLASGNPASPGLREGLLMVSSGLDQAVAGLGGEGQPDTLIYGASEVNKGAGELKEGMTRATAEGTQVMIKGLAENLAELNLTTGELEAIKKRGREFDSLLGRAEDAKNVLSFVYETPSAESYEEGSSWKVALVLSLAIAAALITGGVVARRRRIARTAR